MKIDVAITTDALEPFCDRIESPPNCGAHVQFLGIVRGDEDGNKIDSLHYEAYRPMAEREMERIIRDLENIFRCEQMLVIHRIGDVPAGEAAILVRAFAKHRAEAFGMVTQFIERLKQDVPIWKSPA